jgi:hypothetical protein
VQLVEVGEVAQEVLLVLDRAGFGLVVGAVAAVEQHILRVRAVVG